MKAKYGGVAERANTSTNFVYIPIRRHPESRWILSDVPKRDDFVQTSTDGLQVRPCFAIFSPATLKNIPQFVDESKVYRCLRFVRSNPLQDSIVNPLSGPTIIRCMPT